MKFIKKHSIAIFFILLTILVFILRFIPKKSSPVLVSQSEIISQDLPSGWQIVDDTAVSLKVEKQVDSGYIPLITLIKSSSPDITNPKNYIDTLISGARSAIPSLKIISDQRNQLDDSYLADIDSYYYNSGLKINLIQKIFIRGNNVSTLTASYTDDIKDQINQVFELIIKSQKESIL